MKTLFVWVLLSQVRPGSDPLERREYLGVFATQAACEHMLAALSDPKYSLPKKKPVFMTCVKEEPQQ